MAAAMPAKASWASEICPPYPVSSTSDSMTTPSAMPLPSSSMVDTDTHPDCTITKHTAR